MCCNFKKLLVLLGTTFALFGCSRYNDRSVEETPLAEQIGEVRRGATDRIQIEHTPVNDDDLESIGERTELRTLQLDHPGSRLSAERLKKLTGLINLEHLRIRGSGIDDESLAQIATLENLRILNLPQGTFTDDALQTLKELAHLELLRFGSPNTTDAGMKIIAELPSLKQLHLIDVPITDVGLRELAGMKQLQSLYLDGAKISDSAVNELFRQRPDLHVHFNQQHHDRDPHRHAH
jgi:hypothetical protein